MSYKGFTLVEILIVVVILGILAAIVVPQVADASGDAKLSTLASDLQTVRQQLQLYRLEHNTWPEDNKIADQLTGTTKVNGTPNGPLGPYLTAFPTNPFTDTADIDRGGTKGDGSHAWYYDQNTGEFTPDDAANSSM